jgi:hypothetical protein
MEGNRHPSKNPRRSRVTARDGKPCTNPVHMQTRPQQKAMNGMTRLYWRRFTRRDVGNCCAISVIQAANETIL